MTITLPLENLMLALNAAQMRRDIAEAEHRRLTGARVIASEGRIPSAPAAPTLVAATDRQGAAGNGGGAGNGQ